MITPLTQQIALERKLVGNKILNDVDGPGTGNCAIVEREERPKEGGILVYLIGYKYPFKGIPNHIVVERFCTVKRLFRIGIETLQKHKSWQLKTAIALLVLLPKRLTKDILEAIFDYFYRLVDWVIFVELLKPERYCRCVRELYRSMTIMADRQKEDLTKRFILFIRDILCMLIEFDSAYRFRFQDVMAEVRQIEFLSGKKRMFAETKRLIELIAEREFSSDGMIRRWRWFGGNVVVGLKWIRFFRKIVEEFFREVKLGELKPDEGDRYFNMLRQDYNFEGKTLPERIEERKKIEGDNWHYFEAVTEGFLQNYYKNLKIFGGDKTGAK